MMIYFSSESLGGFGRDLICGYAIDNSANFYGDRNKGERESVPFSARPQDRCTPDRHEPANAAECGSSEKREQHNFLLSVIRAGEGN